ncbi:MAG: sialidase family protein, partial [Promethearchaeota archaeon]
MDSDMATLTASRTRCTLLIILILTAVVPVTTGYATSSQEQDEIVAFSRNLLLSTDDSQYGHHAEVSVAIGDNGTIFAGWKNADLHNGPGLRVSIAKSVDGGTTWTEPFDMPMFGGEFTHQSDPWLYWHDGSIYYAYLEFEPDYFLNTSDPDLFTQLTVAKSDDYGNTWTTA